ncbi:hypothetical protein Slin15195_G106660 [Septoria linicola]|uniref:Uncharacterized protein n=1 Tax=Septoria linicola TaxID=215465 RepID=A0A9Q9EP61_9PEZI|nr:hypothetical protein Slin14017_G069630 [Septoria linicola]USW57347.1 hypothetical protein Slin15195_G106660 [Septoria linicola]
MKALEHLRLDYALSFERPDDRKRDEHDVEVEAIGFLRKLRALKTLTISSMALFGHTGYAPDRDFKSSKHEELIILHHEINLDGSIRQLLRDPMVASLERFILMNYRKDRWISKDGIEDCKLDQIPSPAMTVPSGLLGHLTHLSDGFKARLDQVPADAQSCVIGHWRCEAAKDLPEWQRQALQATLDRIRRDMAL